VRLPAEGTYNVSLLMNSPRVVHCFEATARPNPAIKQERKTALHIEYLNKDRQALRPGASYKIRFRLTDSETKQPKVDLKDVRVLFFLSPGIWQKRDFAKSVGDGVYELDVTPPEEGLYMVFVDSQSQGVSFRQLPHLTLQASAPTPGSAQ
jgi:hypothetical protein